MNGMNAFYTHQQYLIAELRKLDYSEPRLCLEFGAGDGSASVFRGFLIDNPNLFVWAYETSQDWADQMMRDYSHPRYSFTKLDNWAQYVRISYEGNIDLVFVDQEPWDARIAIIDAVKSYAKVIVLHDYDYFNKGVCENIFSVGEESFFAQYMEDFTLEAHCMILPPTLIMRNKNL